MFKLSLGLSLLLLAINLSAQELTSIAGSPGADAIGRANIQCPELGFPLRQARHRSVVDDAGNLYLSGCSSNGDIGQSLVMKVAPDGTVAWLQRRLGVPLALSADGSGDVYQVLSDQLLKLSAAGDQIWARAHGYTRVLALARQPSGIVVIGSVSNQLLLTRYDSHGGVEWTRDLSSFSLGEIGQFAATASGELLLALTETDGLTIVRIDALGEIAWMRTISMQIPAAMAFDSTASAVIAADGSVFATANQTDGGAVTSKLDAAGNVLWSTVSPTHRQVIASAATVDGGVVVTGTTPLLEIVTTKFDASGSQQWEHRFGLDFPRLGGAANVSTDADGNIYVSGTIRAGITSRMAAVKYSLAGEQLWYSVEDQQPFETSSGLAGEFLPGHGLLVWGLEQSFDRFLVARYSADVGARQWIINNPEETGVFSEELIASTIAKDGHSYLVGWGYDYIRPRPRLAAFSPDGQLAWAMDLPETDGRRAGQPGPLTTDADGRLYLMRQSEPAAGGEAVLEMLCFDVDGTLLWNNLLPHSANVFGVQHMLVSGSAIYLAGFESDFAQSQVFVVTEKYALDGSGRLWSRSHPGHPDGEERAGGLAVDSMGRVVMAYEGQADNRSHGLLQYDSNGQLLWEWLSPDTSTWGKIHVAIDGNDDVLVAATSRDPAEGFAYVTRKLNSGGQLLWTHQYAQSAIPTPANENFLSSMVLLDDGSVVVTGEGPLSTHATIRVSAGGSLLWEAIHQNNAGPSIVSSDSHGNLMVAMNSLQSANQERISVYELDGDQGRIIWSKVLTVNDLGGTYGSRLNARKLPDGSIRLAMGIRRDDVERKVMSLLSINGGAVFLDGFELN